MATGIGSIEVHQGLIDRLDLPAKVRLLTGGDVFATAAEPSIGLGEIAISDGPTGVRGPKFLGGRTVALFPNATLLASAWNEDVAGEYGALLAEEAMAQRIHLVLGPTINLHRSPLGGRLFECLAEDPLLTGKLAAAYVRGLQERGIGACLKHLVANEAETDRRTVNNVVDERTLREVYLLPFEIAVADAQPWSIMAAYNDVNGFPATEHDQIQNEIVKQEWGFDGLIMSDWFATKSAAPAANGGLDLVMPGPAGPWGDALVEAVRSGQVPEAVIDDHVVRLLRLADRVGALGHPRSWPEALPEPSGAERREQLTRLAAAGMTVLTNNGVLPLEPDVKVAVIGRHALKTICMGGGSAHVNPPHEVSVADGLTALLPATVTVDGVEVRTRSVPARPEFVTDPETGLPGIHAWIHGADGALLEHKNVTGSMTVAGFDDNYPQAVGRVVVRAAVSRGGPVELGVIGPGSWTLTRSSGTWQIEVPRTGQGFGGDLLNPQSRSRVVELADGEIVEAELAPFGGDGPLDRVAIAGLIARPAARDQDTVIAEAAAAAAQVDVAVVVVGLTEEQETESVDKTTLRLPGRQDDLLAAVAAVASRTVVVVNAATPVLMPWLDDVDAVLWAGLPGQEGGHAVAAALLGHLEPAGRPVTTFPAADGATPAWDVQPVDGTVQYREGTYIGYRGHHAGHAPAPAFWFGHGLGYGAWEYTDVRLTGLGDGIPEVSLTLHNTADRRSREVVQLYFDPADAAEPVRLVGWTGVDVDAGGTVDVTVTADRRMWRSWDPQAHSWNRLTGGGRILVARGLGDVRATFDR